MKRKIQSLVIVGLLLVIAIACQREERETLESKGISLEQAKAFFEKQETEKENNGIDFKITPKWDTFKEEEQEEGKSFAFAQVTINNQNERKAEILFTKTGNNLESIIIAEHYVNDNLLFLISDLEGKIISINYPQKEKTTTPEGRVLNINMCIKGKGPCFNCYGCNIYLVPVPGIPGALRYPHADPIGVCDNCRKKIVQLSDVTVSHNMPFSPRIDPWNDPRIPPKRDFNEINKRFEDQRNTINNYNRYFGSRGKSNPSPKPREIIDNLTNPCAKDLLKQLPNLKNDIAKLLKETFGGDSKYDITFTEDENLRKKGIDGQANASNATKISEDEIIFRSNIYLNPDILENATQEYILVTMYHEVIHAFLNYEETRLRGKILPNGKFDNSEFEHKYPDVKIVELEYGNKNKVKKYQLLQEQGHNRFAPFIEKLAQSIISFNPKIPLKTARAMAKMGIVDEKSMSNEEKLLNQGQRNGTDTKGTKCN
ncbi:hypothetical protein ACI76O_09085 [Capnocytophaga cynodegmi]|uniref:hypothetical protein n=1 Tax=Capnocytophaga cynodegmi TaxID=28189 RepID=UPI00385B00E4